MLRAIKSDDQILDDQILEDAYLFYILPFLTVEDVLNFALSNKKNYEFADRYFQRPSSTVTLDSLMRASIYSNKIETLQPILSKLVPMVSTKVQELRNEEQYACIKKPNREAGIKLAVTTAVAIAALWLISKYASGRMGPVLGLTTLISLFAFCCVFCKEGPCKEPPDTSDYYDSSPEEDWGISYSDVWALSFSQFNLSHINKNDLAIMLRIFDCLKITNQWRIWDIYEKLTTEINRMEQHIKSLPQNVLKLSSFSLFKKTADKKQIMR